MKFIQNVTNLQELSIMRHANLNIGILGGTFDPAHIGHLMISKKALNFYKFDYVIWLVANQNPLKSHNRENIHLRANQAVKIATDPKIIVSTAEYDLGYYYIYDSLKTLIKRFPKIKFSWLMGIDNVVNFRKWYKYKEILKLCDIIIFDRPVSTRLVNVRDFGVKINATLAKNQTNNIIIYRGNLCAVSSTQIRANE